MALQDTKKVRDIKKASPRLGVQTYLESGKESIQI